MTSTNLTLIAVGLAALLLVAGTAAAIPSQAAGQAQEHNGAGGHPADAAQHAGDDDPGDETTEAGRPVDDPEEAASNETDVEPDGESSPDQNRERARNRTRTQNQGMGDEPGEAEGPPVDMPAQTPDHVTQIHETIRSFLAGDLDGSLGQAIAGFVPADGGHGKGPSSSGPPAGVGR